MRVQEVVDKLGLQVATGGERLQAEITGGCVSDLLSYVMGSARAGNVWITIQVHPNIVGVAALLELAAIIVAGAQEPEEATVEKAREQGVVILTTKERAFATAGGLYELGIR